MFNWRNVTPSLDPTYWVKGTVLEAAMVGEHNRFCVESVRSYDAQRNATAYYRVKDADKVDLRSHSSVVLTSHDLDECLAFIDNTLRFPND